MEEITEVPVLLGNVCVTQKFLRALELIRETGDVSMACRAAGISRKTFYKWKRRLPSGAGGPGLPPLSAPPEPAWKSRVLPLCLENPEWGCDRISYYLHLHGMEVSSPTIQKHLIRLGLGRVKQRVSASGSSSGEGKGWEEGSRGHLGSPAKQNTFPPETIKTKSQS